MAAASELVLEKRLYEEPYVFEFFQAVRLIRQIAQDKGVIDPQAEHVRFRVLPSLNFPPSSIHDLEPPTAEKPARMTVSFLGLTGPSGVLPRHYTELIMRLAREARGEERYALRDWLDLFHHRFLTLFYRAWEHYRFVPAYERGEHERLEPDSFTHALYSLIGLGTRGLRKRIKICTLPTEDWPARTLRSVDDLALLGYSGLLSQSHRNAWGLQTLLAGYFDATVEVRQFRGQWLPLEESNQTKFDDDGNCALGVSVVAGDRVWDVQGKILVRMGPLSYAEFVELLPDRAPVAERKGMFLLSHLVRLYAGPELDADVQLILKSEEIPDCVMSEDPVLGPRLGWNCWVHSMRPEADAEDALFEAEPVVAV